MKAIQERCLPVTVPRQNTHQRLASELIGLQPRATAAVAGTKAYQDTDKHSTLPAALGNLLETIMQSENI